MKKNLLQLFKISFVLLLFISCSNDTLDDISEEEVIPVETVTYQDDIRSIIDTHCISCHSNPPQNGAPMSLVTYQGVKSAVQNRGLFDRVSREPGSSGLMPAGGPRLPQADINLIELWIEDGLIEN